jgi:hypothetical protein
MEFDFDTYRLMQIALTASVIVFLFVLLSATTKKSDDSYLTLQPRQDANSTSSLRIKVNAVKESYPLFSAQIDAGVKGDEDQPYYIPSPDL